MKRIILFLILVGIVVAALFGYLRYREFATRAQAAEIEAPTTLPVTRGTVQQTVAAPGALVNTREVALALPVGGRIDKIHVRPGEWVTAGTVLASLDTTELQREADQRKADYLQAQLSYSQTVQGPDAAAVQAAEATLISARAAYTALLAPPSVDEIARLEADLRNAQATLQQAEQAFQTSTDRRTAELGLAQATNNHHAAQAAYDAAFAEPEESALRSAQAQIATAEAQLAGLYPTDNAIAQAELTLEQARQSWQEAQDKVAQATLVAPFDGIVLEIHPVEGESVAANAEIMRFVDPRALEIEAKVIEEDLPLVQIGQVVEIYFDAVPDLLATGHVSRINPLRLAGDRPLYGVYITLDDVPAEVVAGMSSDAAIIIARREEVLQLPRSMVRAGADGVGQVEVWQDGQRETREIKVGLRGDVYVEIVEGLAEGEEVVSR